MATKQKQLTVNQLRELIMCDDVSKHKGIVTFRSGYYYRMNKDSQKYQTSIHNQLRANNIEFEAVDCGDHWAAFNGGASIRKSSHFWAQVKLV